MSLIFASLQLVFASFCICVTHYKHETDNLLGIIAYLTFRYPPCLHNCLFATVTQSTGEPEDF